MSKLLVEPFYIGKKKECVSFWSAMMVLSSKTAKL